MAAAVATGPVSYNGASFQPASAQSMAMYGTSSMPNVVRQAPATSPMVASPSVQPLSGGMQMPMRVAPSSTPLQPSMQSMQQPSMQSMQQPSMQSMQQPSMQSMQPSIQHISPTGTVTSPPLYTQASYQGLQPSSSAVPAGIMSPSIAQFPQMSSYQPAGNFTSTMVPQPNSASLMPPSARPTVARPHQTSHYGGLDYGTYRPVGTEYVAPGQGMSGGMLPTYDMHAVPTFEAPLVIQADGKTHGSLPMQVPTMHQTTMHQRQRGVSEMSRSSQSESVRNPAVKKQQQQKGQKKVRKPQRYGWCC